MKHAPSKKNATCRAATRTQKTLLPLVAVGGSLAGSPVSALELGDMTVQSRLGQPLRASIAYVLAPQEQLLSTCVSLGPGISDAGLPGIGPAKISVADGVILLTGQVPLREPMVAAHVVVDCNYMVSLNREYTLFIDPAERSINDAAAVSPTTVSQPTAAATATRQPAATTTARKPLATETRRAPTATKVKRAPIGMSSQYRVRSGDSLSRIAERIQNRPVGLWPAVNLIFEANPQAFIDNDPNKLMAGSLLTIPSFDGSEPVIRTSTASVTTATQSDGTLNAREERAVEDSAAPPETVPEVISDEIAATDESAVSDAALVIDETFADASGDLTAADPVADVDNPFVESPAAASSDLGLPDTELAAPRTLSASPNVPTAIINTRAEGKSSSSWLTWLAGSGVAIIIALLLFGRLFRKRNNAAAIAPMAYRPSQDPVDPVADDVTTPIAVVDDVDSDSPTEENLSLDADLVVGTGLEAGSHMDAAQDFGFASPTTVDFELAPQSGASADDTILDSEVLPEDEDYDLSVIIDATKMPQPEDITQRDLKAVELGSHDLDTSGNYTINKEVDFDILAQDYEDEFTATQAVNSEIMRAANDLVDDVAENSTDAWLTTEETVLMTKEEETAMMESQGKADSDSGEISAEMLLNEEEVTDLKDDIALSDTGTMGMLLEEDYTLEMAAAENDEDTREMEIDEDTVDTKAL